MPTVIVYNRIDGPGSSLDLREFQQAYWLLPSMPKDFFADTIMTWSRTLLRTVGITIDVGTRIYAEPFDSKLISIQSVEYGTKVIAKPGEIFSTKKNWLLKIIELFGL